MSQENDEKSVFEMKVIQSDWNNRVRGLPYRIIAVLSDFSLYDFAEVITESFDFDFDHCFGFYDDLKNCYRSMEGYELFADIGEESKYEGVKEPKMKDVFRDLKKKWLFLFDYGDSWHFIVQKVGESPYDKNKKYPNVLRQELDAFPQYPDIDDE